MRKFALSIALATLMPIAGCMAETARKPVSLDQYLNPDECWIRDGETTAYVVIHEEGGKYYPYFISRYCAVERGKIDRTVFSFIHLPGVEPDDGVLKTSKLFGFPLEGNLFFHPPLPDNSDPVYVFRGRVKWIPLGEITAIKIVDPKEFSRQTMNFEQLRASLDGR